MSAAPRVRDVSAAQALRADHDAVKAEIEARDDTFRNALELGGALVQGGHRNAQVICYLLFTGVYYKQIFLAKLVFVFISRLNKFVNCKP